ncbi:hypothetical protein D3880_12850 [Pseudomonas cavernae]|uniref:DNA repair protein n=1 Tax=Pseudomonas cavernae TaxID=2320867 RepID=A0A385Z3F2_9PSED|nr:hypothetical protein [Pseudomonas cavernae]AYC33181.1 hypothetical protein D3880_12850 [Pseudomonas cavernae]
MSPLVITLLIVGGIAILIAIGYINHMVENNKLEKARLKADLSDRVRRCREIAETLPGQFMSPALKLLLAHLQLQSNERLLPLDKHNTALKVRIEELRYLVGQGESIAVANPPQKVLTEAKAKDIRYLLENLHGQIGRASKEGTLQALDAKHWAKEIQQMLVHTNIELFTNLGQQALQQNQPGQARLAFERGVQYLRKQNDPSPYQAALKQLEMQLARANSMVLDTIKPLEDESSELTDGLKSLDDDGWKKKQIYD